MLRSCAIARLPLARWGSDTGQHAHDLGDQVVHAWLTRTEQAVF